MIYFAKLENRRIKFGEFHGSAEDMEKIPGLINCVYGDLAEYQKRFAEYRIGDTDEYRPRKRLQKFIDTLEFTGKVLPAQGGGSEQERPR